MHKPEWMIFQYRLPSYCIRIKLGSSNLTFKILDFMKMNIFIRYPSTLIAVYKTENATLRDM